MTTKTATLVGASMGLALFLAVGLLPALLYGGYAGVLLAGGILGTPLAPSFLTRCFIVSGMVLGVAGVASLFTIAGAVVGAVVHALGGCAVSKAANSCLNRSL